MGAAFMDLSQLENHTRVLFEEWRDKPLTFSLIEKGGSGRFFVRVAAPESGESVIAMLYTEERSDNSRFASITDFLNTMEVPAPEILQRREDLGMLWVEDLGEVDLKDLCEADWETIRKPACQAALRAVARLHAIGEAQPPASLPDLERPFDEALYRWEQDYFTNQFVERFISPTASRELQGSSQLEALAASLSELPRSLLHRDFQSTNVMVVDQDVFLIDYQGLRWGIPEYDIASMIYDPYVEFSSDEREALIAYYFDLKKESGDTISEAAFRRRLNQCASQRLMQALGAYGYLSEVKGKPEFLEFIQPATARLLEIADEEGGLPELKNVLA
ncbi:MAG: phosphotransferase [Verrucomicrobiota bacterium]